MKYNISKELFEAVYNCDITTDKDMLDVYKSINIYEFVFKCKEWAYSTYGIMIQSYPYCGKGRADALKGLEVDEVFKENTELEAILKASEYILKELNENR